jgi:hypothetical protein
MSTRVGRLYSWNSKAPAKRCVVVGIQPLASSTSSTSDRVVARASSVSSAAVSETEKNADGRALRLVWCSVSQSTISCWWWPAWTDAPTTVPSNSERSRRSVASPSRRARTSIPSARMTVATRSAILAVWPWVLA